MSRYAGINNPNPRTTPFNPAQLCRSDIHTSAPHSQAYHASPAFEKDMKSWRGNARCSRIQSPTRMCHPVSPSDNSASHPFGPARNSQIINERNRKSASVGVQTDVTTGAGINGGEILVSTEALNDRKSDVAP